MKAQNINTTPKKTESTVEVLYQKMGDRWFAFSLIDDEVFVGSLDPQELEGDVQTGDVTHERGGNA